MSYVYMNKYLRFHRTSNAPDPLDSYTLALSTLSLTTKSTSSPRRLSSLLLPAYALLHPSNSTPQLTTLSPTYTILRSTLVQAELILIRVLGFELDLPSPLRYLARYLARAMEDVEKCGEGFDEWDHEAKEEYGVLVGGIMDGRLGRGCRGRALDACKSYDLSNLFPARAVALGVVLVVLGERGLRIERDVKDWVLDVGSGKVDVEDFEEVIEILRKT
ncbi:MAG: hypothetical protein Q9182_003338 [Xanthomendoza sp. 2 TL-2023]